jgi:hypothetical protein
MWETDDARTRPARDRLRSTLQGHGRHRHRFHLALRLGAWARSSDRVLPAGGPEGSHRKFREPCAVTASPPGFRVLRQAKGRPRVDRLRSGGGPAQLSGCRAGCEGLRMDAAAAPASGRVQAGRRDERRSPGKVDDRRPLAVASAAVPLGTVDHPSGWAILREQVLVGSAVPRWVRPTRNCTDSGWSPVSEVAAVSAAARVSARGSFAPPWQRSAGRFGVQGWSPGFSPGDPFRRTASDTSFMEQAFNGRSPREHRVLDRLQCRTGATDSRTDQGLEVEEPGLARTASTCLQVGGVRGRPRPTTRRHVLRWPASLGRPTLRADDSPGFRDLSDKRSADERGG